MMTVRELFVRISSLKLQDIGTGLLCLLTIGVLGYYVYVAGYGDGLAYKPKTNDSVVSPVSSDPTSAHPSWYLSREIRQYTNNAVKAEVCDQLSHPVLPR